MWLKVLGSAAGGGFPQWNCHCPNCDGLRRGTLTATPRTQSSIALSENGTDWLLVNASPDLLTQIHQQPALHPARAIRDSGIAAVLLTDAQIDHVTGLLMLRERPSPLPVYATAPVLHDLKTGLPLVNTLSHYCTVDERELPLDGQPLALPGFPDTEFTVLCVVGKAPPYSPNRNHPQRGDNIALLVRNRQTGKAVLYAPGLEAVDETIAAAMQAADILLLDGTFWTDDEMIRLGLSKKRARDMGHVPQSGPGGLLDMLEAFRAKRRILIHINNTNPILDEHSAEAAILRNEGVERAVDGMDIEF